MTDTIPTFARTESGNNQSTSLFPESLPPSQTTDNLRRQQAAIRNQWNQAQWFATGDLDGPASFSFISGTQFRLINAVLATEYHVGRRVRARGSITGRIVGSITAVAQTGGNTDVTVNWDTGALSNEQFEIELSIITATESGLPRQSEAVEFSGDNSFDGNVSIDGNLTVGGTLTGQAANFDTVSFDSGPFNFLSASRRLNGGSAITVPPNTKQIQIEVWSAGGGGSATNGANQGAAGEAVSVTTNPPGREIDLPGGARGGGSPAISGQDAANTTGVSTTGVFLTVMDFPGLGAPGGSGAGGSVTGNPGHYVRAIFNATPDDVTSIAISGGQGGAGGDGGANDGGRGGRAGMLVTFWG